MTLVFPAIKQAKKAALWLIARETLFEVLFIYVVDSLRSQLPSSACIYVPSEYVEST
jgi:hypothetical protein